MTRPPSSLRTRLLIGTTLSLAAILAAASATLYVLMRASLVHEFDGGLVTEANALARLTEQDGGEIDVELEPATVSPLGPHERPHYFEMWSDDGKVIARTEPTDGLSLWRAGRPGGDAARFEAITLPGDEPGRAVFLRFEPRDEGGNDGTPLKTLTLAVARDTRRLDGTLARLRLLLLGVSAAAVVAGTGVVAWVIGRGLRPLRTLAGQIERVGVNDLSERLAGGNAPSEVAPVVQRLNELLARLEGVVERERAFTADVAHELRTPLSGLSSLLEVCASRPRDGEAYRDVLRRCLRVTGGMRSMVNNLLTLARADCGQIAPKAEPVEVAPLLRECWEPLEGEAGRRALKVEFDVSPTAVVRTDGDLLRMIVGNVLGNAVTYADAGGHVRVRAEAAGSRATLTVSNTGSRIAPDDAARVFDRFWRGDAARSEAGVRCGLGLSLCRKLTEVLGATIAATSEGGTFTVALTVPAAAAAPVTAPAAPTRPALQAPAR